MFKRFSVVFLSLMFFCFFFFDFIYASGASYDTGEMSYRLELTQFANDKFRAVYHTTDSPLCVMFPSGINLDFPYIDLNYVGTFYSSVDEENDCLVYGNVPIDLYSSDGKSFTSGTVMNSYANAIWLSGFPVPFFSSAHEAEMRAYLKGANLNSLPSDSFYLPPDTYLKKDGTIGSARYEKDTGIGIPHECKLLQDSSTKNVTFTWKNDVDNVDELALHTYLKCVVKTKTFPWQEYTTVNGDWIEVDTPISAEKAVFDSKLFALSAKDYKPTFFLNLNSFTKVDFEIKTRYEKDCESFVKYGNWVHCTLNDWQKPTGTTSYSREEEGTNNVSDDTNVIGDSEFYNPSENQQKDYGVFNPIVKPLVKLFDDIKEFFNSVGNLLKSLFFDNLILKNAKQILNCIFPTSFTDIVFSAFSVCLGFSLVFWFIFRR